MPPSVDSELPSGIVLCIDQTQEVLDCERAFLESCGYTVLMASSGGEGLELASLQKVAGANHPVHPRARCSRACGEFGRRSRRQGRFGQPAIAHRRAPARTEPSTLVRRI